MQDQDSTNRVVREIWFPAKRYGWGWGLPIAWQGWVVFVGWLVVFLVVSPLLAVRTWGGFYAFVFVMAGLLTAVCYAKGEKPRWRWGE